MLFDLSSPGRKTVIRIVYGVLALLFFVGFVGFGIGGEIGGGGIIDSITGGGGSGSTAEQYEQQIEDAEEKLEADPENERALADLAQYRYLSGQAQLDIDETTGAPRLTEEARGEFEASVAAWTDYLALKPQNPDVATAGNVVQAYVFLNDVDGAIEAQRILAEANPSAGTYSTLAYYQYAAFEFEAGDRSRDLALAEAKPAQRKQVERQLETIREQAVKFEKQQEKLPDSATGGTGIDDPFGPLDPSGTDPTAPPVVP